MENHIEMSVPGDYPYNWYHDADTCDWHYDAVIYSKYIEITMSDLDLPNYKKDCFEKLHGKGIVIKNTDDPAIFEFRIREYFGKRATIKEECKYCGCFGKNGDLDGNVANKFKQRNERILEGSTPQTVTTWTRAI